MITFRMGLCVVSKGNDAMGEGHMSSGVLAGSLYLSGWWIQRCSVSSNSPSGTCMFYYFLGILYSMIFKKI